MTDQLMRVLKGVYFDTTEASFIDGEELGLVPSMSHEGIRKRLKKTVSSRGRRRSGG